MVEQKDSMGFCPFTADSVGDPHICFVGCGLWNAKEGCCDFHLIALMLRRISDSLALMAAIFERESS